MLQMHGLQLLQHAAQARLHLMFVGPLPCGVFCGSVILWLHVRMIL